MLLFNKILFDGIVFQFYKMKYMEMDGGDSYTII